MPRFGAHRLRAHARGFTLVELMTVVAITGVLAAIGVTLVRGHVSAAKTNRALVGIQAIRVAEEAYRAQSGSYLGCSTGTTPKYYPMETPGKQEYNWIQTGRTEVDCWRMLGVPRNSFTQYGYLVHAGRGGDAYPTLDTTSDPAWPADAPDLWYVIQVKGDIDGDGVFMQGVATSYTGNVYIERETE
jgi:prepilin-type N-terminal cleavage/methylation domain-containing protein